MATNSVANRSMRWHWLIYPQGFIPWGYIYVSVG
nr:MAG TPA: Growth/differentiation factor [Caudoviricetes sp.]